MFEAQDPVALYARDKALFGDWPKTPISWR
jgi:hypothetical protein